jgi:hypothetical protein
VSVAGTAAAPSPSWSSIFALSDRIRSTIGSSSEFEIVPATARS